MLGIKTSCDDDDGRKLIEDLIDDQHYARPGFALVAQGTPTNNTDGNDSGYARAGRSGDESAIEVGPPLFTPTQDRTRASDGQRLADFLGVAYDPLLQADGAGLTDFADAVAANRALYAGTLGYYLDHMLDEVVDEDELWTVRGISPPRHRPRPRRRDSRRRAAVRHPPDERVRPLAPDPGTRERRRCRARAADPFESVLQAILTRFDEAWSTLLPGLTSIGSPGDGLRTCSTSSGSSPPPRSSTSALDTATTPCATSSRSSRAATSWRTW